MKKAEKNKGSPYYANRYFILTIRLRDVHIIFIPLRQSATFSVLISDSLFVDWGGVGR